MTDTSIALPSMRELDQMDLASFISALAVLFEGAPVFVARLAADRPFGTYDQLLDRARVVALAMPETEQLELIDAHPRIGAPPAAVSPLSYEEQGYDREPDGLSATADEGAARQRLRLDLERLNDAHEARFGFRFVIFVAGRPRQDIAKHMEASLGADREAEKRRALADIIEIARDRLRRIGAPDGWSTAKEAG